MNPGYLSTVKNGEVAINNQNFIIDQLVVTPNQPKNIDEYDYEKDKVKSIRCTYNKSTGQFNGLTLQLAYIVLRGDTEESFFSYGINEEKSSVLNSVAKQRIPKKELS